MSGFGKKESASADSESLAEIEKQYKESVDKIRKILGGRTDKKDLSTEDKQKLRTEYLRASQLASKLSTRYTDNDMVEKYKKDAKKLSDRAAEYGSAINSKIPETTFDDVKGLDEVKKNRPKLYFHCPKPRNYQVL